MIGSLACDPLIPLLVDPPIPSDAAVSLALLCALATLPFLAQRTVHKTLSTLRLLHSKSLTIGSKALPISLAVSAGALLLLKILMFSQLPRGILVIIIVFLVWGSRQFITQARNQTEEDKNLFRSNPWAKVQRWEHQVFVFTVLPLALARAISLSGSLAALPAGEEETRIVFLAVSALFLGMLQPDRSFFIGTCRRCQRPVPIVFQDIGSCLSCDANLRFAYHSWVHKIPVPSREGRTPSQEDARPD